MGYTPTLSLELCEERAVIVVSCRLVACHTICWKCGLFSSDPPTALPSFWRGQASVKNVAGTGTGVFGCCREQPLKTSMPLTKTPTSSLSGSSNLRFLAFC